MKTLSSVGLHFPFSPWTCAHGWDDEKEGKPCPACHGFCFSCGKNTVPLDKETGNCLICQDVFDSDYEFYKESNELHEGVVLCSTHIQPNRPKGHTHQKN